MNNLKPFLLLVSFVFLGLVFLSGANHYGFAFFDNSDFLANFVSIADTIDEKISPSSTPFIAPNPPLIPVAGGGEMGRIREVEGKMEGQSKIRQGENFMGGRGMEGMSDEQNSSEEFIDPREVKNSLREIRDMKKELKRLFSSANKISNADAIKSEVSALIDKIKGFEDSIKSAFSSNTGVRDAIDEYRQAEVWNEINSLRTKIELPKQLKNSERDLNRLLKMTGQKSYQVFGLDLDSLKLWVSETRAMFARLNELYSSGNMEDLNNEMQDFQERANPGEPMSVLFRMRDLKNKMKWIKDEEVKNSIEEALSDVIKSFNERDYRSASEILNEYQDDMERLIIGASKIGRRGGMSEEDFDGNLMKVKQLIEAKLGQRIQKEEIQPPLLEPSDKINTHASSSFLQINPKN